MVERRGDHENRQRLEAIQARYERFAQRVWVALGVMAMVLIVSLAAEAFLINETDDQADAIREIAERADERAQDAAFTVALSREKVCAESTDRIVACRALFDRLAESLSEPQRVQLACNVILHLRGATARQLRVENSTCRR